MVSDCMLFYGLLGGFEWLRHHISRWDGRHALTSSARGSFSGPDTAVKEICFFESFGGAHFRLVVYPRGLSAVGGHAFSGEVNSGRVRPTGNYEGHPQSDASVTGARGVSRVCAGRAKPSLFTLAPVSLIDENFCLVLRFCANSAISACRRPWQNWHRPQKSSV